MLSPAGITEMFYTKQEDRQLRRLNGPKLLQEDYIQNIQLWTKITASGKCCMTYSVTCSSSVRWRKSRLSKRQRCLQVLIKNHSTEFSLWSILSFRQITFTILYCSVLVLYQCFYFQVTSLSTNSKSLNFTWKHNKSYNKISSVFLHVHSLWPAVKCSIDNNASMCGSSVCVCAAICGPFLHSTATVAQPTAGIWTGVREIRSDRGLKRDGQRWEEGGKKTQGKEKSRMFRGRWQTGEGREEEGRFSWTPPFTTMQFKGVFAWCSQGVKTKIC